MFFAVAVDEHLSAARSRDGKIGAMDEPVERPVTRELHAGGSSGIPVAPLAKCRLMGT